MLTLEFDSGLCQNEHLQNHYKKYDRLNKQSQYN